MAHCEILLGKKKNGEQFLLGYHCKDQECSEKYKRAKCK